MSDENQKQESVYVAENATEEAETIFGAAPVQAAAPEKKGGLSRNVKWLIAGICAVVLLGGGLTAMLLLQKPEEPADSMSDVQEKIRLNNTGTDEVTSIDIKGKENGDFTVDLVSKGDTTVKSVYGISGLDDVMLDTNLVGTLIDNGNALEADSLVAEKGADLSIYGLAEPSAAVTMHYADGQTFTFGVGDAAPTGSAQTYCEVDGNVYLVRNSLLANYLKKPEQFVSPIVLPEPSDEDYPIVQSVLVERDDLDYDILLEYDYEGADDDTAGGTAATHIMKQPTYAYLSPDKSVKITNGMFGLTAIAVDTVHPTAQDLAEKGLDKPFCLVTMKCDDGTLHELRLGNAYETELGADCYYATFDDVPVIYGLTQDDAAWGTVMPGDITSASVFVTMVWDIGSLDVKTPDGTVEFRGKGDDKENYEVTKNGEACDTERFRQFYHFLLSIYGEEMYYDALPETDPDVSIHLHTQNDKQDYTVSLYKISDMKTIICRDGGSAFVIRTSCLNMLLHNLEIIDDPDQDISLTWQ